MYNHIAERTWNGNTEVQKSSPISSHCYLFLTLDWASLLLSDGGHACAQHFETTYKG